MAAALGKAEIRLPPINYAEVGYLFADVLQANLIGGWYFNQYSGESDEDAAFRCSQNWAPGASNQLADRVYPIAIPTQINANYFRFNNLTPLVTRITLTGDSTMIAIARTTDTTIGNTGSDRGFICGTLGNTANDGDCLQFTNATSGQVSAIASDIATDSSKSCVAITGTNDLDKWRIWAAVVSSTTVQAFNLDPADGSTPSPAATPLVSGHKAGTQTFTIGGRITSGVNYNDNHKDIAAVMLFDTAASGGQLTTLATQLARTALIESLTLGAV